MVAPTETLWEFEGHTAAKHLLLEKYLDAWLAIMGQFDQDLILVDGFCGPGEYLGGQPGSPTLMLQRYEQARANLRHRWKARVNFWFIDQDARRVQHLEQTPLVVKHRKAVTTQVGQFHDVFPPLLQAASAVYPQRGMFAFIDPFGADGEATHVATEILGLEKSEVLLYVPTAFMHRFVSTPEFRGRLSALDDRIDWDDLEAVPKPQRRVAIRAAIAAIMPCDWVRWFEVTPAKGSNTYTMIFGTNNKLGLQRMKDAMWQVDPAEGASFKDITSPQAPTLFELEPDYALLRRLVRDRFGSEPFTVAEVCDYVLCETAFRDNGHLKKQVLKAAETDGELHVRQAKPTRRAGTFGDDRMVLQFV
jgi:three-Cys-motif partner protein